MKISEHNPLKGYSGIKKKLAVGTSTTSFADLLSDTDGAAATSSASPASAAANVSGLLGLQEVSDEDYNRKKQIQQGYNLINSLESLRHSLLMGQVPVEVMQTLESRLKQQRMLTIDPALHEIMDDIELRVAVELAKLEMSRSSQTDLI